MSAENNPLPNNEQHYKGTPHNSNANNNMWGLLDNPPHVNLSTQLLHGSVNFNNSTNNVTTNTTQQQDNSSSIISSPTSASAANNSVSIMRFVKDNMWQFFSVIQHRYAVKGRKIYILFILLHIYYSYVVMILPTLSSQINSPAFSATTTTTTNSNSGTINRDTTLHNYPYGFYGTWLFKAMNYPITLSLDWIPYEAAIAVTIFGLSVALVHITILFLTFKTNFGRLQEKLKNISFMLAIFILFIGPPTAFVMTSFIDCNYQQLIFSDIDKMYSASLWRYPNIICSSSMNVSMIVVSIISIVLFSFGWLFSLFILPMANPKSQIPFLISYKLPMCVIYTSTGLRILVHFAIPSQYSYARAAFHIVASIGFILFFTDTVPLYRRVENSIFFSVLCTYCAFAVGLLVSSIVNSSAAIMDYDLLGIGLGAGLTVGLPIVVWILSFTGFEIYTRVVFKNIQKIVRRKLEHDSQHDNFETAQSSIYMMCEEYSMRNLKFYLQFVSQMPKSQEMVQALSFVKSESPQKFFTSPSILMMASDLVARCWGDENRLNFALFLLKKALKHNEGPWLAMQIKFKLRDVESELFENANYGKFGYAVKNVLMEIEKKQDQIKSIHKLFWKELLSDIPNNEKLERINATATHLTHYCEEQFEHLLANFAHDKTVLRYYANFLETIKQDKESAVTYYEEAASLEEEDSKNKFTMKRFRNKVIPELAESQSWNFMRSSSRKEFNNEDVEKDSFDGVEKQLEKKQNIYRNSLNTPFKSRSRLISFCALNLIGLGLLFVAFVLSLVYGDYLSKTDLVKVSSLPILTPGALLRDIRMRQIVYELFNVENKTYPSNGTSEFSSLSFFLSNYKDRIRRQREILLDLSSKSRSGEFKSKMYADFIREDNVISIPVASESGKVEFKSTFPKNTSISDVVHELIQHSTYFNLASDSEFNKTTTSYPFMYIYHNRRTAPDVTFSFFKNFQESQKFVVDNVNELLWNYILISALVYIGIFSGFIVMSRVEMQRISFILALYRKLPKDMIGVIYHEIDKKGEDVKYEKSNIFLRPKEFSLVVAFCIIFIIAAYSGIIYFEISENVSTSTDNLTTVNQLSILIRAAHRLTIRLGELFAYFGCPTGSPVNIVVSPSYVAQYRQDARGFVSLITSSYNEVVYGNNNSQPLIGRFSKIDNIINGPSNCTADSPVEECSSLQTFISAFTISSSQMTEEFFNPTYQKSHSLFYQVLKIYNMNDVLYARLMDLMNLLFISTSESFKVLTITFFIFGVILYLLFSSLLLYSFLIYDRQITNLRSFLNYLPVDYIDSSEAMRNFIYFNSLTIFKKKIKEANDDSLRNVLSSMVDGALLVNEKSEIMLFNLTAQKMFGKAPEEVIGLKFYNLFEPSQSEKLTSVVKQVKSSLTDPNSKHGETLELDCIRKNQSKFPAIVNIFATRERGVVIYAFFIKDITSEKKQNALLNEEKKNSENLLRNILPDSVAFKLKAGETLIADKFSDITCFFSDMVGFTKFSSGMNPNELVIMLNTVVNGFDDLTDKYQLEKIKTIGDAYFCVGGLHGLNAQSDHPERCVKFAIDTLQVIKDYNIQNPHAQINIRVGLNTGSVVAGVIGRKKFAYDLWGDTINIASRMESNSLSGRIQLSRSSYERVYDIFEFEERKIEVKGKGMTLAYLLKEKHHCNPIITIQSHDDEDDVNTDNDEIEVEKKPSMQNLTAHSPNSGIPNITREHSLNQHGNNSTPNVMSDTMVF